MEKMGVCRIVCLFGLPLILTLPGNRPECGTSGYAVCLRRVCLGQLYRRFLMSFCFPLLDSIV